MAFKTLHEVPMSCTKSQDDFEFSTMSYNPSQDSGLDKLMMACEKIDSNSVETRVSRELNGAAGVSENDRLNVVAHEQSLEEPMVCDEGSKNESCSNTEYSMMSISETQDERLDKLLMAFKKIDNMHALSKCTETRENEVSTKEELGRVSIDEANNCNKRIENLELPVVTCEDIVQTQQEQGQSQLCLGNDLDETPTMSFEETNCGFNEGQIGNVDSEKKCSDDDMDMDQGDGNDKEELQNKDYSEKVEHWKTQTQDGSNGAPSQDGEVKVHTQDKDGKVKVHTQDDMGDSQSQYDNMPYAEILATSDSINYSEEVLWLTQSDSNYLQSEEDAGNVCSKNGSNDVIMQQSRNGSENTRAQNEELNKLEQISIEKILKFSKAVHDHLLKYMTTDTVNVEDVASKILSRNSINCGKTALRPLRKVNDGCDEMPEFLIGHLTWNKRCSLEIEDNTNTLTCVFQSLDFSHLGQYILVLEFQYIDNNEHSYVEIFKYECISQDKPTSSSISSSCEVTGIVRAVSTPLRQDDCYYYMVEVDTSTDKEHIIVTSPQLLSLYRHIIVNEYYTFARVINTVLGNQLRAKVTTRHSTIKPADMSSYTLHLSPYTTPGLVMCKGTITKIIIPEAGLYEINDSFRLYLHNFAHISNGEGLHPGTVIHLSNFHIFNFKDSSWKHLSGVVGCIYSTVRFLQFSKINSNCFKPFISRGNKLVKFLRNYSVTDAALLLEIYKHCSNSLRVDFVELHSILEHFIVLLNIETLPDKTNSVETFFSSPHECSFNSVTLKLSTVLSKWPTSLLTIDQFKKEHCNAEGITDSPASTRGNSSNSSVQWRYIENTVDKILIGYLSSDYKGGICISDHQHNAINIVLPSITPHIGSYIIITKMRVIKEHTYYSTPTLRQTHNIDYYVYPLVWKTVNPQQVNTIPRDNHNCSYFIVITKNLPVTNPVTGNASFQLLIRIAEDIRMLSRAIGTECVLNISDIDRYYSYLEYGCLYSLLSLSQCCSEIFLTDECVIELLEESDEWCVFASRDVSELINMSSKYVRETPIGNLVTFNGIIVKRSYRLPSIDIATNSLNQFTLALDIKSVVTPDTIVLYIHTEHYIVPVGLVPGAKVKFSHVLLKCSRSDNIYCTFCEHSSVQIISFPSTNSMLTNVPVEYELPVTDLYTLIQKFRGNDLLRNIVCILGWVMAIQYFKLEMECAVHRTSTMNCSSSCWNQYSVKIEGSALFSDGSGECQIYFDSDTAQAILKCCQSKWTQLLALVEKYRIVKYYRIQQPQNPAEELLCSLVKSLDVKTQVKLNCQPFNNCKSPKEGIKLKKIVVQNISHVVESFQKLQLKVFSVQTIHHRLIARKQYDQLMLSSSVET